MKLRTFIDIIKLWVKNYILPLDKIGDINKLKILIDGGSEINVKKTDSITDLIWTAIYDHPVTVKQLIQQGVDVNAKKNDGWTALI